MSPLTKSRGALLVLLAAAVAHGKDKTPPTYQHGTIGGWTTRIETRSSPNGGSTRRRIKVYELKGPDLVYQVDECGAFQAGGFIAGQAVDFRVDDANKRVYIRHDNNKEYKCKMEGASTEESEPSGDSTSTH